jgi:MFS family permease
MARLYGACLGLLLFSAMILCGMVAGNSVQNIVLRALAGLAGGFIVGSLAGWIGLSVAKDNAAAPGGDGNKTPEKAENA